MWKSRAHDRTQSNRLWTIGFLLLLAATTAPMLSGMPRGERHEERHEIDQLEDAWREAVLHRDVTAIDRLLADDYVGITASGMLESKDETIEHLRDGTLHFNSIDFTDRKVRFYGSTAVVTSRAEVSGRSPSGDISGAYRYTRVYVREPQGEWRIVSFEVSSIRESDEQR
jgi:ketosteroid isomerase-like protein